MMQSVSSLSSASSSGRGSMHPITGSLVSTIGGGNQDVQYCPVTQLILFISIRISKYPLLLIVLFFCLI